MNTQVSYFKKALVVLMAVMMVFTMMPSMAWADDTEAGGNESSASGIIDRGDCGAASNEDGAESVKWELSTDGTLTISGTGAMENYKSASKRPWHANKEQIQKVCIENGVTSVAKHAFNGCTNLQNVTLGNSIVSIGSSAFRNCSSLTAISLPETLTNIGGMAFMGCIALKEVTIPKAVTVISGGAFNDCTSLETLTLDNKVTEDSLPTINDPYGTYIDGCTSLQNVIMTNAENEVEAENGVFYSKGRTTLLRCLQSKKGEVTVPNTVKTIKENAFNKCSALEKLILPETIETAYNGILFNCSSLWYVELKGVTEVVRFAFDGCTALDQLVLPACLTSYAETSVTPKLICFRGTEAQWEAATTETVRTKLADKGTVVVYNYDDQTGAAAAITVQPEASVNIGLGQTKYLSVTAREEEGTQYYYRWFKKTGNETKKVSNLSEDARYKVDSSTKGTTNYYCEVVTVKDGKTAVTKSNEAAVTVGDLQAQFSGGSGTNADPYQLSKPEDLTELAGLVNSGISFEGKYFKLTADITLAEGWTPIGCKINSNTGIEAGKNLYAFSGTIDGVKADGAGNYTLTVPKDGLPLLGYVKGATVKNLNLAGERINGYGLVNNFEGVGLSGNAITIDNVTIKSGTSIVKSGLLGANITENPYAGASAEFVATIRNCTIEAGAVIGCDGDQNMIGGFAGRMQGTIENCKNYGTVKGKNVVGGIIGTRDNALKTCTVKNCGFYGSVIGEENVGGIVGSGYMTNNAMTASAPNGQRINILGNTVGEGATVTGNNNVGGILGSDLYVAQVWDNVIYTFAGNSFSGKISGKTNVGGIIGFYDSLNKYDNIAGNFYKAGCGATKGIGAVKYVDTNAKKPTKVSGTTYINTEFSVLECPAVEGCKWQVGHNRTDDPLGADASRLAEAVETIPTDPICYELTVKGTVKDHYVNDELDLTGLTFTAKWTGGKADTHPTFGTGEDNVKATGYDKTSHSIQTVILSYGYAQTTIQVAVKKQESTSTPEENKLKVSFTLLGDSKHEEADQKGGPHGLALNKLDTWLDTKTYEVALNSTVWDLMKQIDKDNDKLSFNSKGTQYGIYIYSVTYNGEELGEFDNGKNSGWMYTVNGTHPEVGVGSRFLNNGDVVVFHYTDDYTKEEGSEKWNTPGGSVVEEVKEVTTDTKAGTTTAPTDVKVSEKTNADGTKTKVADVKVSADNQKEILKQAKEKKSNEIILVVSSKSVGDATKADVTLDKSFIDSIVKDTNAKLTIKTPFGDKTYTQEELKAMSEAATGSTVTVAIEKAAEEPTDDAAAKIEKAKSIVKDMKLVARSSKTAKKNIKAVLKSNAKTKASVQELKELGFTVKYRFYRSTKKASSYKSTVTKKTAAYTNTSGKKGTKYFYKVQVRVYDENGKLIAKTALKQCKYASRTWSKVK